MSSEIYELLKRPDEYVVEKATGALRRGRTACAETVRGVLERWPDLPGDAFLLAHQENFETIHTHDVEAEEIIAEIRRELDGGKHLEHHTTLRELWDGRVPAARPGPMR